VPGLAWTGLCPACRWEREGRARRLSSRIALAATALMGLYLVFRLPPDPTARLYGGLAVVVTYVIVRRIASRLAMEFLPR
jgi:hypothetical protein